MNNKRKFLLVFVGVVVALCSITFIHYHNTSKSENLTFEQAELKGLFKIDVRKGDGGEFRIKPFKFSEIHADSVEVFFRNEGINDVYLSFVNIEDAKEHKVGSKSIKISVGESVKKILKNESDRPDDEYIINISDPSEPMPVVIGEFYVKVN